VPTQNREVRPISESGRLKIDRDDTLDGSARDSATRRSRPRVETRPIDAGEPVLKPNRTTGFPLWKGSPAVYGGRGCHDREPIRRLNLEADRL